jgi:hypothetical protein
MSRIWLDLVAAVKAQRGASNLPLVAFIVLFVFLICGPFSGTAEEIIEPALKHLRRLLR